jgi:uncharacterized protein (TIGR02217 family)
MALTVMSDVLAPNTLWSSGVSGKQRRMNRRAQAGGGAKQINVGWSRTERYYEFGTVPMLLSVYQTLEGLFEVTEGGAYGFLVMDPKDNSVTATTGRVSGLTSTTFQLVKRYTAAGSVETKDRTIKRPRASDFVVMISGTPTGLYTLDDETGIVTIAAAPSASNVTWAGHFYVPVHFESDEIDWDLVAAGGEDSRYVSGPNVVLCEVRE